MLSKLSNLKGISIFVVLVMVAVSFGGASVQASKMSGKVRSTDVPLSLSPSVVNNRASIGGSLLSWDGLGTSNALLSAAEVERLDVALRRDGFVEVMKVDVDCRGRFNTGTVLPGVYHLDFSFDGKQIHSHKVELSKTDSISLEVGFKHNSSGPNVYVRGFGPSSSSVNVASTGENFLREYLAIDDIQITDENLKAEAVFDELEAPVELFQYKPDSMATGSGEGWESQDLPASLPSFGSGSVIIDPDVNVSQLHKSSFKGAISLNLTAI